MKFIRDTSIVAIRELRPTFRDPFTVMFGLIQPLVFLALYGPLLGASVSSVGESPWQWFVPGIVVMIGLFSTSVSGSNLLYEMQTGSHERLLVTPLDRSALLVGRALKEIVPLLLQALLIVVIVLPFGFRLYPLGVVAGLILLAAFGVGLGALSYTLAINLKPGQEALFWLVQQTLLFPLLILSGMLLPIEGGPGWMQVLSRINPLMYIVEAERALFVGQFLEPAVLGGVIAAAAMAVVGLTLGTRAMRQASA
jgi:ABC-2 type transport system permease protein